MTTGLAPVMTAALLGGCSLRVGQPVHVPATTRPPTKDESARERAARLADDLADDLTDAARASAPGSDQADRLRDLAVNHRAQAAALRPAAGAGSTGARPGRPTRRSSPAGPGLPAGALGALATRERAAAAALAQDLMTTTPATSRLLASVRASCLVQVERLDRWARQEDR
jgi:hypothetical protein